jgi:hypothetical protein
MTTYNIQTVTGHVDYTEQKYKTLAGAQRAVRGLKRMASRYVFVHREQQVFYAKSAKAYDRGDYKMLSYCKL